MKKPTDFSAATSLLRKCSKMGNIVGLVRAHSSIEEIKNATAEALDLIEFKPKEPIRTVDIKVNLCYYWQSATGYTTDPRLVASVIDCIREKYSDDAYIRVVEADATAMRTRHAFKMLGYEKLAKEKNIELFNLSTDDISQETVHVNGREISFQVPKSLLIFGICFTDY